MSETGSTASAPGAAGPPLTALPSGEAAEEVEITKESL